MSDWNTADPKESLDIAIIGMACRFPGADTVEEFWRNLRDGVESITFFTDEEMQALGVAPAALRDPAFIKAGAILKDVDRFDASFFGYSPREAEALDPQHRIFLECAWHAYENAGYQPDTYEGLVGVYAGTSLSTYLLFNILSKDLSPEDSFQAMIGNDKDFLSTRVSYEMGFRGPSLDVQTACSTSLVAVHLACQSLLSYQCDMALAGGVSVQVPQRVGYYYQEGGINSPDGHCRAFDARAGGTIFGSGAGIVVLKRLADALVDGDMIQAIIKGSAINNDGSTKVGYTAPGVDGQAQAISMAQVVAGVEAETIGYVEAHGTGTDLGDPVEVAALTKAFRASTSAKNFCALGSVKTNFGHLDAAAGVAGLIKTALALKHRQLPPSLHYEQANPKIDFENTPFYVNARLAEWETNGEPRRAGVSSFGIGGTNAHVILEEAPAFKAPGESRHAQLIVLSAKTETALESMSANLADHLKRHEDINVSDVAHTLQVGRKAFNYRRAIVCRGRQDLMAALETLDPQRVFTAYQEPEPQQVVFMFPGGGAQYVNMAAGLYEQEAVFRAEIDSCSDLLLPRARYDLRDWLFPDEGREQRAAELMKRTSVGLPALFAVEYALARLWMSWGVLPEGMIGHSLGEYVAACLAGVFTLEDALSLVLVRGKLFEQLPSGAMLSVPLPEADVLPLLDERLSLAAINGPSHCVVSGPAEVIDDLSLSLGDREIESRRLQIDVAAHSHVVEEILAEFTEFVETINLHPPTIPFVSNVTGTWISPGQAGDPLYWARHLRETVRFADGVTELLARQDRVLLEVGPGQTLTTLARTQADAERRGAILASMRHPYDAQPDTDLLLGALGKLWLSNVHIDWQRFYADEKRSRVPLPNYPFERQRYWIEPGTQPKSARSDGRKKIDFAEWFYAPLWKQALPAEASKAVDPKEKESHSIVFADEGGLGMLLATRLEQQGRETVTVVAGSQFARLSDGAYSLDPRRSEDYAALIDDLLAREKKIHKIIHAWSLAKPDDAGPEEEVFNKAQEMGFYSLMFLVQALADKSFDESIELSVLSNDMHEITGHEELSPARSTLLGLCTVIPQEYPNIRCRSIDISNDIATPDRVTQDSLVRELTSAASDLVVAYRGGRRWVQTFEQMPPDAAAKEGGKLRDGGVYLVTGGLGGVGSVFAEHLAERVQARLILTGRSALPARDAWAGWLASHEEQNPTSLKIKRLQALERLGAEILYFAADVADLEQMSEVIALADERFGQINGVIHAAGIAGPDSIIAIPQLARAECERQFRPKVKGLIVLEDVLGDRELDFCVLVSSVASLLGGIGHSVYAAANLFMDAFASRHNHKNDSPWLSVGWDVWQFTGEREQTFSYKGNTAFGASVADLAMSGEEGVRVLDYLVSKNMAGRVLVSTGDLQARIDQWIKLEFLNRDASSPSAEGSLHSRPTLGTAFVAPDTDLERTVARVWQEALGIERVGVHDNFFDLGGNSLLGLRVVSRLKKALGIDVPVVALFEGPTIFALTRILGREQEEKPSYEASRGRGERRREKRQRKRQAVMERGNV